MDLSTIPEHMREGVRGYIEHGGKPGSFLNAILCNNLVCAARFADDINKRFLFQWALLLYNDIPRPAWGDQETVNKWIAHRGKENV